MKEELKNLTPEMVEELRKLGVEFEDTQMIHVPNIKNTSYTIYYSNDLIEFGIDKEYENLLPAPNLQEVLEKLPKSISKKDIYGEPRDFTIELHGRTKGGWYISYDDEPVERLGVKHNKSALKAAYELLKWVATNYPESLKGGSDD